MTRPLGNVLERNSSGVPGKGESGAFECECFQIGQEVLEELFLVECIGVRATGLGPGEVVQGDLASAYAVAAAVGVASRPSAEGVAGEFGGEGCVGLHWCFGK